MEDLAFSGVGISHAAFGGAAIGLFFGFNPYISAVVYSAFVALLIVEFGSFRRFRENTMIGVFFSVSMAIGYILVAAKGSYSNAWSYLFGSVFTMGAYDIVFVGLVGLAATLWFLMTVERYILIGYSEELAESYGINVKLMRVFLMLILSLSVVASMKLVGVVLVNTLLVIPGAMGKLLGRSFRGFVVVSVISGFLMVLLGFFAAVFLNLPPGAVISLFMVLSFSLVFLGVRVFELF